MFNYLFPPNRILEVMTEPTWAGIYKILLTETEFVIVMVSVFPLPLVVLTARDVDRTVLQGGTIPNSYFHVLLGCGWSGAILSLPVLVIFRSIVWSWVVVVILTSCYCISSGLCFSFVAVGHELALTLAYNLGSVGVCGMCTLPEIDKSRDFSCNS